MLYAVRFHDKPECWELRKRELSAHIAWLAQHSAQILVAGSLRDSDGPPDQTSVQPVGGLWLVEASSRVEVHRLMQTDPFWTVGLRQSVEVLLLSKANPNEQRLV